MRVAGHRFSGNDTTNRRRGAHRPVPCSPPSSAELSGDVSEHCLSEAQRSELRSRPTDRAAQGTLREAHGGEPGSPSLVTFLAKQESDSPAGRDRRSDHITTDNI